MIPPIPIAEIIMLVLLGGASYLVGEWRYGSELKNLQQRTTLLKLLRDQKLEDAKSEAMEEQDGT